MPKQEYQYGQGFENDLNSLLKLVRKESADIDGFSLQIEVKKIIKYNKFQSLPDNCPKCKEKNVDWDWEVGTCHSGDESTNDATCPNCNTVFFETMKTVSWEYKNEEDAN